MKQSIIITGKQEIGKSTLAKLIIGESEFIDARDIRSISSKTKFILLDEISSANDWSLFRELSTCECKVIRPYYSETALRYNFKYVTLIGISQSQVNKDSARHSLIFNLY